MKHEQDHTMPSRAITRPFQYCAIQIVICILIASLGAAPALAVPQTGDLITSGTDDNASPKGAILCVDPQSGAAEIISSGGLLRSVGGIVISQSGSIFATTQNFRAGGFIGVVMVDPETGYQTPISEGGFLDNPVGIVFDHNGMLLVACEVGGVVEVDPTSGAQRQISSGGMLNTSLGIVVEGDGSIVVSTTNIGGAPHSGLVRINPADGSQSLLANAEGADWYFGMALNASEDILVGGNFEVLSVDPTTGNQTQVTGGHHLTDDVTDVAVANNGELYVATLNPGVGITRIVHVDLSGSQRLVAEQILQGLLEGLWAIAIYPDVSVQTITTTWGRIKASRR